MDKLEDKPEDQLWEDSLFLHKFLGSAITVQGLNIIIKEKKKFSAQSGPRLQ